MRLVGKRAGVLVMIAVASADQLLVTFWGRSLAAQLNGYPERWLPWAGVGSWVLALGICIIVALYQRPWALPLGLIAAGALSNTLSFFRYGSVIDFIPFWLWYTNTADIVVMIGGIWLVLLNVPSSWWRSLRGHQKRRGRSG
jgi:lipoprotein signal peptidase